MVRAIADTHTVIWYLFADPRLSPGAKAAIDAAEAQGNQIGMSSITFAEVVYLSEKRRIEQSTFDDLLVELDRPDPTFVEVAFDRQVGQAMLRVDRAQVPDMPDRIIAATAIAVGVPVISRDRKIRLSSVATIW